MMPDISSKAVKFTKRNRCDCSRLLILLLVTVFFNSGTSNLHPCYAWEEETDRHLRDECFAIIIYKNAKKLRRFPHHGINGKLDTNRLIYALGTIDDQTWENPDIQKAAKKHLENHYNRMMAERDHTLESRKLNLNIATLSEMVYLPTIGPVLAVKIMSYRQQHGPFKRLEDILQIDGIGRGILSAIRHYTFVQ